MKRKYSPLHNFWHRRVEGQIRDCMHAHPRWFVFASAQDKEDCVNSLAKRIVGEIVAETMMATVLGSVASRCGTLGDSGGVPTMSSDGAGLVDAEPAPKSIFRRWW